MSTPGPRLDGSDPTNPANAETRVDLGPAAAPEAGRGHANIPSGAMLGRYLVLGTLGVGGMGHVVRAYDSRLRREVALKLVRLQPGKTEGAARVMREAQAMATLAHPNVVGVFDVERDSPTLLYLAMEYVPGVTLYQWLRVQTRPLAEIIDVFVQAGCGLAAAHAAGIIHRDFKPTNVMIGEDGRARVTDFGLARGAENWSPSSSSGGDDEPLGRDLTQDGQVMGTPAYMAPEQHLGHMMGPASDQYAFCVALYEAVAGQRPFQAFDVLGLAELKQRGPPPFPSDSKVPGWLQRVILRGLQPEPIARWPDMERLLRALRSDPTARRRRWAGRGVVGLALAGVVAASFASPRNAPEPCPPAVDQLVGVWDDTTRAQLRQAISATKLSYADETWSRVEAGLDAYTEDWLAAHHEACMATAVTHTQSAETFDRRMVCLHRARSALAVTVRGLAIADAGVAQHGAKAVHELPRIEHCADLERLAELAPPTDPALAERVEEGYARLQQLEVLRVTGRFREGHDALQDALSWFESLGYLPLTAEVYDLQTRFVDQMGQHEKAVEIALTGFSLALEARADHAALSAALELGWLLGVRLQRYEQALQWNTTATSLARRLGEPEASAKAGRATILRLVGRLDDAEPFYLAALGEYRALYPEPHPRVALLLNDLGNLYLDQGRWDDALVRYRAAYDLSVQVFGPTHPHTSGALLNVGSTLVALERFEEAEPLLRRALQKWIAAYDPRHHNVALARHELGRLLLLVGRTDEAATELSEALDIRRERYGPRHPDVASSLAAMAAVARARDRWTEAESGLREALSIYEATLPAEHPSVIPVLVELGEVLEHDGRTEEARTLYERAATAAQSLSDNNDQRRRAESALRRLTQ